MNLKATIEIPTGSRYKYEMNKQSGSLVLDRVLNQSIPANYGFFPGTFFEDGDPLDVFVISENPIAPLAEVEVEILGVIRCKDGGVQDDKIIGHLVGEPVPSEYLTALITRYLTSYKESLIVEGHGDAEEARDTYMASVYAYEEREKFFSTR